MPDTTLTDDLANLRVLKESRDSLKAAYEAAEREFKIHQTRCMERMEAEGHESTRAGGVTFTPVSKVYATVQDRAAFVQWAKENDDELVEYKERSALTNALVRQALDSGEALPPGLGFYTREYMSMREAS